MLNIMIGFASILIRSFKVADIRKTKKHSLKFLLIKSIPAYHNKY